MKIQFNTDKTISGEERNEKHFTSLIENGLKRFDAHITRVEVHLSDENGKKEGPSDMKCTLETRMEGRQPIVVSSQDKRIDLAITNSIDKMKRSLESVVDRMQEH